MLTSIILSHNFSQFLHPKPASDPSSGPTVVHRGRAFTGCTPRAQHSLLLAGLHAAHLWAKEQSTAPLCYDAFAVMGDEWEGQRGTIYTAVEVQEGFWVVPVWYAKALQNMPGTFWVSGENCRCQ